MPCMSKNTLYYGDNLQVLREHIKDESIDLIYLDPPFNSKATYNVLFSSKETKEQSPSQIAAFEDTWHWGHEAQLEYSEIIKSQNLDLAQLIQALREFLKQSDMMAYLVMMANRLVELHRVLKPTGSLYLHCDPTASHYLKIVLDSIFGAENFKNEIIWRRTGSHNSTRKYGQIHDSILFYSKTKEYFYKINKRPYMKNHVESRYILDEEGRLKFSTGGNILTGSGITLNGDSGKEWRGFNPTLKKRHWAIPGYLVEDLDDEFQSLPLLEKLEFLYSIGRIEIKEASEYPTPVNYLKPDDGQPYQDIWAYQPYTEGTVYNSIYGIDYDVSWLGPTAPERIGYQTQKPLGLLERIIKCSCPENGIVLDPFCGCGTAIHAAQKLNRAWLGIDITHLAISLIEKRLKDAFPGIQIDVQGTPKDLEAARDLFHRDAYQFQWWAVSLVNGIPFQGKKKGADSGIDGIIYFDDGEGSSGKYGKIIISVKGGEHINVGMIRDLKGTIEREKAAFGLFITLSEPTEPMLKEAAAASLYPSKMYPSINFPAIQILTIEGLLNGTQRPEYPNVGVPEIGKKAIGKEVKLPKQESLFK